MNVPIFHGVVEPERSGFVESTGLRIHYLEWGDPSAQPVVLCHGMWDHARSFATLAPLLAERYRVVALDARGHGDSDWASAYTWPADIVDLIQVLRWLGRPAYLIGHSKGGGQATDAAGAVPHLVRKLVNIDGFGPPPFGSDAWPGPQNCRAYLDGRRAAAERQHRRPYASPEQLIERRLAQNPRLSREWLHYFVFHGASQDDDGWRWKSDPLLAANFGPWRPDWITLGYARLKVPVLAVTGSEQDTWGPLPETILAERLARIADLERVTIEGTGHFVHMERPNETARVIIEFLES